ncbi:MAG: hypothetical protein K9G58_10280 [Bacteroidales bacterium]|nr:hypothetical protein [Bacteroidales bacterium]MCF8398547.1 hypothetical protein [Bacteroidales bacterium]
MEASSIYHKKIRDNEAKLEVIIRKKKWFTLLRAVTFLGSIAGFYFLFPLSLPAAILAALFFLALFIYFIQSDIQNSRKEQICKIMISINRNEIEFLNGNFSQFEDGAEYTDPKHPYTFDLDIFGEASLFQFLNRTSGNPGKGSLAGRLMNISEKKNISREQEAVKEISAKLNFRQQLIMKGMMHKKREDAAAKIIDFLKSTDVLSKNALLKFVVNGFPFLSIPLVILSFFIVPPGYLLLLLMLSFLINYQYVRKAGIVHNRISGTNEALAGFAEVIALIEKESFSTANLSALKEKLFHHERDASEIIQKLSKYGKRLDYRLNIFVAIPLNLFLLWDLKQLMLIEKWKKKYHDIIPDWFNILGDFESLSCFGNIAYNFPDWHFPEVKNSEGFVFEAEEMGHPLISRNKRINNDFKIHGRSSIAIITGSNMSGKTTFLRTIGVNLVLAQNGAPVCAKSLRFSPVGLHTSMRIMDSLSENTSSFYAELKRLNEILQRARKRDNVLLLMDEILRGTNSHDRHLGSEALVRQLVKNKAVGLLATHDLELSQLEKELPENIANYNFDVQISGKELFFDYKLHPGVCKSMNATILMEKMGIEMNRND